MKKILIGIVLVALVILSFVFYFRLIFLGKETQLLSNTTELYSSFTPYMQSYVSSHLQSIDCIPEKYYYDDSSVCFLCNDIVPCFSYSWVNRTGGERMNPYGLYLKGEYNSDIQLSFYSFGISKLLNCECDEECTCEDGVKATFKDNTTMFTFPTDVDMKQKITEIAGLGINECDINVSLMTFSCGNLTGYLLSSTEVVFMRA